MEVARSCEREIIMARRFHDHYDSTGDIAARDLSAESVFVEILSRIDDERERVYLLAHIGLDISVTTLARELKVDRRELATRVDAILAKLRVDADLASILGKVRHAGRNDRYQALAFRLELQNWFCSHCGAFMIQPEVGRPRKTCSDSCRRKLCQARGRSWKDSHRTREESASGERISTNLQQPLERLQLETIMGPFQATLQDGSSEQSKYTFWWQSDIRFRDRALLLLGLTSPIPLTCRDLATLDVDDFAFKPVGLEIRLHRRTEQPTRYLMMPPGTDQELCAVKAVMTWRGRVTRTGRTLGPLFVRLDRRGLTRTNARLAASEVATIIENAARRVDLINIPKLLPRDSLPEFLASISRAESVAQVPESLIPILLRRYRET
jgi:hypothetical protein